jgi:hypothetical protein
VNGVPWACPKCMMLRFVMNCFTDSGSWIMFHVLTFWGSYR